MRFTKYATAYHRGGLKECIKTENDIQQAVAEILIKTGIYKLYAYDKRIKADRYILEDMEKNLGLPTWIHIYKD